MKKNYLPIELGVALKEQHNTKEELLFTQPTEHEIYVGSNGYGVQYFTWGDRDLTAPSNMRIVAFMEWPMDYRTGFNPHSANGPRSYDPCYHLHASHPSLRKPDEEIEYMWLGGYIYKAGQLAYNLVNSNLLSGSTRHNGCKMKLAAALASSTWTEFKRSDRFKTFLPIEIMNATTY